MNPRRLALSIALASSFLAACSDDTTTVTVPDNSTRSVSIAFEAVSGSTPIACGTTLTALGTTSTSAPVRDFRYYIHDVKLVKADGSSTPVTLDANTHQLGNVALIDHTGGKCDATPAPTTTLGSTVTGKIPNDSAVYTGLEFTVGVPQSMNHRDRTAAASPLNIAALHWAWQSGYKHATLEVQPTGGITRPTDPAFSNTVFNIHLGSTGCTNSTVTGTGSCTNNNRPLINLSGYTLNTSKVRLDYAALVANSKLTEDGGGPAGCMSGVTDPECGVIFDALGLNLTTGVPAPALTQTVFSLQ
ncbi:MAG: metallo-mystery pair system four-Cys motif protein [Moraxellaceae bacterium]|nr:metallo-mystery pair system four-Cys motif protein [Moraxellaceae bacterium]